MNLLINIYFISLGILTILNRGGAGLGFGFFNITILLTLLAPLLYLSSKKNYPINLDFPILTFILISLISVVQNFISFGFSSEMLRPTGILLYPASILAGISLARPNRLRKTLSVLKIILTLCLIYAFLYPVRNFLVDTFTINNISLFGIYGSYYTITVISFCFFYSGFGTAKNKKVLSITSSISTLILASRNGILGLFAAFLTNVISKRNFLFSKKSLFEISFSIVLIVIGISILFPFLGRITTGVRGGYDIGFFFESIKSIFFGSENESLSGSSDHRILMLFLTIEKLISNLKYFFLGIPLNINYTGEVFNDPHNGYLSLFARGGILNILSFIFLQYKLIRGLLISRSKSGPNNFSSFALSFSISSLFMITFSTILTSPMNAIPYYFLIGLIWQINNSYLNKQN